MFKMVLNTPQHHLKTQTFLQVKRKVVHIKVTTKTSTMKIFFNESAGKI